MKAPVHFPPSAAPMAGVRAFYPGIVTARYYETWDFYTEQLGFRTVCEWDTFVQLEHPSGAQISVLKEETEDESSELVSATDGRGIWLNFDVADVDAEYTRLSAAGVPIVSPPELRGAERRFTLRDPNGILIFVTERAAPRRETVTPELAGAA